MGVDGVGDEQGEMGDNLPFVSLAMDSVQSVSVSNHHVCALSDAGKVKCWGPTYEAVVRPVQHDDDDYHHSKPATGSVAPAPAVRPTRDGADQQHDQNN